jgi:acyl-CoA synthetase (AMP-forming)/AMP-acid ligase II
MNVALLLSEQARAQPDRPAVIDRSGRRPRTLTFAELDRAADRAANVFRAGGLEPGDPVVVLARMSAELYIGLAGLLRAGCVATVCDPGAGRADVERCCALVRPRALFAGISGLCYALGIPQLARIRRRFACTALPGVRDITAGSGGCPAAVRAGGDAAILSFTSGSTGPPKVVVRSHALLRAQLAATRAVAAPGGVDIATMPIVLLANLAAGVTSVIPGVDLRRPGRADAERLAADIAATGATSIVASPAMLERLARLAQPARLKTLKTIVSGGAPVMPSLISTLQQLVPGADVVAVYGSTEAEPIAHIRGSEITAADRAAMRAGAGLLVGPPVHGTAVRIVPAAWGMPLTSVDPLGRALVGEIVVSGAHVVPGYLDGRGECRNEGSRGRERVAPHGRSRLPRCGGPPMAGRPSGRGDPGCARRARSVLRRVCAVVRSPHRPLGAGPRRRTSHRRDRAASARRRRSGRRPQRARLDPARPRRPSP